MGCDASMISFPVGVPGLMLRCYNVGTSLLTLDLADSMYQNGPIMILCFQVFPALVLSATKLICFIPFAYVLCTISNQQLSFILHEIVCCV